MEKSKLKQFRINYQLISGRLKEVYVKAKDPNNAVRNALIHYIKDSDIKTLIVTELHNEDQ